MDIAKAIANSANDWLPYHAIEAILMKPLLYGFPLQRRPLENPQNGQLVVYDKFEVKNFKQDGVNWAKKANGRLQETYKNLKIDGVDRLFGVYCNSVIDDNLALHRRIYRLINEELYVLVHYRLIQGRNRSSKSSASSSTGQLDTMESSEVAETAIENDEWGDLSLLLEDDDVFNGLGYGINVGEDVIQSHDHDPSLMKSYVHQPHIESHSFTNVTMHSQEFGSRNDFSGGRRHDYQQAFALEHPRHNSAVSSSVGGGASAVESHIASGLFSENYTQIETRQQNMASPFLCQIVDFAPTVDSTQGGTKMLICLSTMLPNDLFLSDIAVCFGSQFAMPVELVLPNVLRCRIPPSSVGSYNIFLIRRDGKVLSSPSAEQFHFVAPSSIRPSPGVSGTLMPPFDNCVQDLNDSSTNGALAPSEKKVVTPTTRSRISRVPSSADSMVPWPAAMNNGSAAVDDIEQSTFGVSNASSSKGSRARSPDPDRDDEIVARGSKIRIVQIPGILKDSNGSSLTRSELSIDVDSSSRINALGSGGSAYRSAGDEWLDELELGKMSPTVVENMMDDYMETVVRQLVQLASSDEELIDEIHDLDANGFSLLHYCCMYKLTASIPVLLAKGANINQQCLTDAATPLHLAVTSGHLPSVALLISHGADTQIVDDNGNTPLLLACALNKADICAYFLQNSSGWEHHDIPEHIRALEFVSVPSLLPNLGNCRDFSGSSISFGEVSYKASEDIGNTKRKPSYTLSPSSHASSSASTVPTNTRPMDSAAISNKLLQDAFYSLSLTDKCAFARSISSHPFGGAVATSNTTGTSFDQNTSLVGSASGKSEELFPIGSPLHGSIINESAWPQYPHSTDSPPASSPRAGYWTDVDISGQSSGQGISSNAGGIDGSGSSQIGLNSEALDRSPSRTGENENSFVDMQSVLSESDKQSLGVVMAMMGEGELIQVESEVRKIQNNVRGWLLRKNFMNLRSAARKMQNAWRIRKVGFVKSTFPARHADRRNSHGESSLAPIQEFVDEPDSGVSSHRNSMDLEDVHTHRNASDGGINQVGGSHIASDVSVISNLDSQRLMNATSAEHDSMIVDDIGHHSAVDEAAAKLQAVTRGVIARKSFAALRKQAVASIMIQKRLMQWWYHKDKLDGMSKDN